MHVFHSDVSEWNMDIYGYILRFYNELKENRSVYIYDWWAKEYRKNLKFWTSAEKQIYWRRYVERLKKMHILHILRQEKHEMHLWCTGHWEVIVCQWTDYKTHYYTLSAKKQAVSIVEKK